MPKFSLINQLDDEYKEQAKKDPNAPNITYLRYDLDINDKSVGVLIPMRECTNFENRIMEEENLSNHKMKKILREFRGLWVREE